MLKTLNQTTTFLLEIAMLISMGYYAMAKPWSLLPKVALAIGLIAVAILLWAILAAPRSTNRLDMPYLVLFRAGMFLVASFLLYQSGQKNIALVLAALAIVTQTISLFTEVE